jgi:hypothetical protein
MDYQKTKSRYFSCPLSILKAFKERKKEEGEVERKGRKKGREERREGKKEGKGRKKGREKRRKKRHEKRGAVQTTSTLSVNVFSSPVLFSQGLL